MTSVHLLMGQHPPFVFFLVDAKRWQETARALAIASDASGFDGLSELDFVSVGGGDHPPCVLVRSTDLAGLDDRLDEWMLAAASRFADAQVRYCDLTPRERQVLPLITDGLLNKQAAHALGISEATLQIHRGRIMHKMGVRTFAELVRLADVLGLSSTSCSRAAAGARRVDGGSAA